MSIAKHVIICVYMSTAMKTCMHAYKYIHIDVYTYIYILYTFKHINTHMCTYLHTTNKHLNLYIHI